MLRVMVNFMHRCLTAADVEPARRIIHAGNLYLKTMPGLEYIGKMRKPDGILIHLTRDYRYVFSMVMPRLPGLGMTRIDGPV